MASGCEDDHILLVPPLDGVVAEKVRPEGIQPGVTAIFEQTYPKRQVLLIDMVSSPLPGNGGGEKDARRKRCQIPYQRARTGFGKVFGNL